MKRFLLLAAFLLMFASAASAQESEYSGGGGTAGAVTGSGSIGRVPQFDTTTSLADSKMLTSGTNSGTWTLYDDTAAIGVSSLTVRAGEGQATVPTPLLNILANNGTTVLAQFGAAGTLGFNQAATTTDTVVITPVGTQSTPLRIKGAGGVAFARLVFEDPFAGSHILSAQADQWDITGTAGTPGVYLILTAGAEEVRLRSAADGAYAAVKTIAESITLNTGGATTDSAADLLPANAVILGVTWKITSAITGIDSTAIELGDATIATRFGTGTVFTSGTTGIGTTQMSGASVLATTGPTQAAAAKLRITLSGGADNTPSGGVVKVVVTYYILSPPS